MFGMETPLSPPSPVIRNGGQNEPNHQRETVQHASGRALMAGSSSHHVMQYKSPPEQSLYKVITGRPVSLHTADVHLTSDALLKYCSQLTDSRLKFIGAWASTGPGGHSLVLGQWVLVSKPQHLQTPLEPKFEGPYQIILVTDAAVKVKGKQRWIHATREIGR